MVELEPVTSYVEMSCVDPKPQEEKQILDVPEDGLCNVIRDNDQKQEDEFFESNENDEPDDFDVTTVPMTFHPVVKDAGTTVVSAKDVEKSSGAIREEWRVAIQSEMQSLREHDVFQEVTEDERWTVPSENIIPGKSVFTIKREGTKKVRIVGCGNFQEDTGFCKCERDNCQSGHVDCRYVRMVLDRNRCKNCFSARISGRTGGYLRKTSTSVVSMGFH